MSDLVRISATAAGISYYPEHVARHLGFFEEENLDVQLTAPGHGPWVVRAIRERKADLALGGIWRPILYRNRLDKLMSFVQLCWRCPAVLLARTEKPAFKWSDLVGRRVAVPEGAFTIVALLEALRKNHIEPTKVKLITNFVGEEALELFAAGAVDFYAIGSPGSDMLVSKGEAFEVADLGYEAGYLPWSVYYCDPSFLENRLDVATRFAKAIQRALDWTHSHDPAEAPIVVEKGYPSTPPNIAIRAVQAAKIKDLWPRTVRVDEQHLDRWQRILIGDGFFDSAEAYEDIFDERPAHYALAELPHRGTTSP